MIGNDNSILIQENTVKQVDVKLNKNAVIHDKFTVIHYSYAVTHGNNADLR